MFVRYVFETKTRPVACLLPVQGLKPRMKYDWLSHFIIGVNGRQYLTDKRVIFVWPRGKTNFLAVNPRG
jgi:hypothetical protein